MVRALLIGYGNTLRGDDGLGVMAVERLRPLLPEAECVTSHQLTPELAERLSNCDLAVFIDAASEGQPGKVHVERLSPAASDAASLTHHVNPTALLELAHSLYGHTPQAMLVTSAGATFESVEGLSEKAVEALNEICRLVPMLVRDFPAMW